MYLGPYSAGYQSDDGHGSELQVFMAEQMGVLQR